MDGKIGSAKITTLFPNVFSFLIFVSSSHRKFLLLPIGFEERNQNGRENGFKRVHRTEDNKNRKKFQLNFGSVVFSGLLSNLVHIFFPCNNVYCQKQREVH